MINSPGPFFHGLISPAAAARFDDTMTSHKPRRAFAPLLLLLLCAAAPARGQQAYKIEDINYTRCDLSEVPQLTDLPMPLFVELDKHPDAKVVIVVYARPAGEALSYARHVRDWLTERRGVAPGRLSEAYGGPAEKKRVELWLVPAGAQPPRAAPLAETAAVMLFDSYNYWGGEYCSYEREIALEVFAEALKLLPGWHGTLVVRPHVNPRGRGPNDVDWDYGAMNRRRALRQAAKDRLQLVRQLGLPPERIRAVVGAPSDWAHAELWLIPPAAGGPARPAGVRRRPHTP